MAKPRSRRPREGWEEQFRAMHQQGDDRLPSEGQSLMLEELESVVLAVDLPKFGLSKGDLGTVVLVHQDQGYEVEFVTLDGETLAVVSLSAEQVRPIGRHEIAHARAVSIS